MYAEHFPETFRVRDHNYIVITGWDRQKIIFNHPTLKFPNSTGKMSHHMGELLGLGFQAVGPNSTHPSNECYDIKNDIDIQVIPYEKFKEVFGIYMKKPKEKIVREHQPKDWQGDKVEDIPISNIISYVGLTDIGGGCYQGPHPYHGSANGMNFKVDDMTNTWICFRCNGGIGTGGGGGPAELIAVMEGIIDCSDASKSCFTPDQGREVIKAARENYGLDIPEKQETLREPRGWSKVLNIQAIAEKEGILNCPQCDAPLSFNIEKCWFSCKPCNLYGGLKKLILLKMKHNKEVSAQ